MLCWLGTRPMVTNSAKCNLAFMIRLGMKEKAIESWQKQLSSGLIDHIQKMMMATMAIADMKVWAQRS